MRISVLVLASMCLGACIPQRVDSSADVSVLSPRYAQGAGPQVVIDGGHGNFHTVSDRFRPFAELLRNDGLRVDGTTTRITDSLLANVDVLVVANASIPGDTSAFTVAEIETIAKWVGHGGALLLIADHIPFPIAVTALARAFNVEWRNNFVDDDHSGSFTRENGGLTADSLSAGISRVRTFSGSGFTVSAPTVRPLLVLGTQWTEQVMEGEGLSMKRPAHGMLQGAVLTHGAGRVAVFGEAGMFTAQRKAGLFGGRMGFHAPGAEENKQFILNVVHWLAGADSAQRR